MNVPRLLLASLLAAGCSSPEPGAHRPAPTEDPVAAAAGMPAVSLTNIERIDGTVRELAPAGHYTYVRVASDAEPGAWAVVLGSIEAELGEPLSLAVHGAHADFHSRRLGRDFDQLFFARVINRA